jgi:hypothetical protein
MQYGRVHATAKTPTGGEAVARRAHDPRAPQDGMRRSAGGSQSMTQAQSRARDATPTGQPQADRAAARGLHDAGGLHSCLYEGTIYHRRAAPEHAFRRRAYLLYLDLDELPAALDYGRLCSAERTALARFRREDHFGDPHVSLAESVRELVERETGVRPSGPIRLLTQLRHLGIAFNPISVFYCYDATGGRLQTLVAEVRNTPWLEVHPYVLELAEPPRSRRAYHHDTEKTFHVSPFMSMGYTYKWRIGAPGDSLLLHIASHRNSTKAFEATLRAHRRPLTRGTLARMMLRYPLMSAQVIGGIYFEALRLWRKGARFYSHPRHLAPRAGTAAPTALDLAQDAPLASTHVPAGERQHKRLPRATAAP